MKIAKFALTVDIDYGKRVAAGYPPMKTIAPRDLRALAVYLNALADAPESIDVQLGVFHLEVEVESADPLEQWRKLPEYTP